MESLEGYSYYDTPSGPQYIRNDNLESTFVHGSTGSEPRKRNAASATSSSFKYHPYPLPRRPGRESSGIMPLSAPETPISDYDVHHCLASGTIDPQSLRSSEIVPLVDMRSLSGGTDQWSSDRNSFEFSMQGSTITKVDPMNHTFTRRLSQNDKHEEFHEVSGQITDSTSTYSWPAVETQLVQASTQGAASWPSPKLCQTSRQDVVQSPSLRGQFQSPSTLQESYNEKEFKSKAFSQTEGTPSSASLNRYHAYAASPSAHQHISPVATETLNPDYMLNETLFEYGPFYDHYLSPLANDARSMWARNDSLLSNEKLVMTERLSSAEPELSNPQVNLVGGYFAPDEDIAIPVAPEVDSKGNIRIERLPPKRSAVVYELPALCDMTVTQLKSELKKYGLPAIGKKSDLQMRLRSHLEQ